MESGADTVEIFWVKKTEFGRICVFARARPKWNLIYSVVNCYLRPHRSAGRRSCTESWAAFYEWDYWNLEREEAPTSIETGAASSCCRAPGADEKIHWQINWSLGALSIRSLATLFTHTKRHFGDEIFSARAGESRFNHILRKEWLKE